MSLSSPFIARPAGTTLLTVAVALVGVVGYQFLSVSPIPQVEFPTISVNAGLPGASPETMASSVATPLERQFGRIAGVAEMTSTSFLGSTSITLQFDLSRNIDAAARDVQAAINAARGQLPANLPSNPTYRKVNPADAPIMILAITSETYGTARMYDVASSLVQQKLAQIQGVGQVFVGGGSLPAVRVDVNPTQLNNYGLGLEDVRAALAAANANRPKGDLADDRRTMALATTDQLLSAAQYRPLVVAYQANGAVLLSDVAKVTDDVEDIRGCSGRRGSVGGVVDGCAGCCISDGYGLGAGIGAGGGTNDRRRGGLQDIKGSAGYAGSSSGSNARRGERQRRYQCVSGTDGVDQQGCVIGSP